MFRACAWCGIFMGVTVPIESSDTTHGMCARCLERVRREDLGRGRNLVIVVRHAESMEQLTAAVAGLSGVTVVRDRRTAVRRQRRSPVGQDRRREERRRGPLRSQRDAWLALGVQVVPAGMD